MHDEWVQSMRRIRSCMHIKEAHLVLTRISGMTGSEIVAISCMQLRPAKTEQQRNPFKVRHTLKFRATNFFMRHLRTEKLRRRSVPCHRPCRCHPTFGNCRKIFGCLMSWQHVRGASCTEYKLDRSEAGSKILVRQTVIRLHAWKISIISQDEHMSWYHNAIHHLPKSDGTKCTCSTMIAWAYRRDFEQLATHETVVHIRHGHYYCRCTYVLKVCVQDEEAKCANA
jgi:hypothetical protein